eukprot:280822-Amphidinium_carterae.1
MASSAIGTALTGSFQMSDFAKENYATFCGPLIWKLPSTLQCNQRDSRMTNVETQQQNDHSFF